MEKKAGTHGTMVIRTKKISYRVGPLGSSHQGQYEGVQDILLMTELLLRRREMLDSTERTHGICLKSRSICFILPAEWLLKAQRKHKKKGAAFALLEKVCFLFGISFISNSVHSCKHLLTQSLDGMGDFRRGEQEEFFFF